MNKNEKKTIFLLSIISVLLLSLTGEVIAAQYDTQTDSGYIAGIHYISENSVATHTDTWEATVLSTAASRIGYIGISYWTIQQICTGNNGTVYSFYKRYEGLHNANSGYYIKNEWIDYMDHACPPGYYVSYSQGF